jgi:hypothetical protein
LKAYIQYKSPHSYPILHIRFYLGGKIRKAPRAYKISLEPSYGHLLEISSIHHILQKVRG